MRISVRTTFTADLSLADKNSVVFFTREVALALNSTIVLSFSIVQCHSNPLAYKINPSTQISTEPQTLAGQLADKTTCNQSYHRPVNSDRTIRKLVNLLSVNFEKSHLEPIFIPIFFVKELN